MLLFGLAASGGGAYGAWYFVLIDRARNGQGALVLAGVFVLIAIFGLYLLLAVPKYRVVLYADRIEVHEFLKARTLLRDDILGRRVEREENSSETIVLVPRGGQREIQIARIFRRDELFWEWIETLPDLDAQDLQASQEEILGSPEGGTPRAERAEALARGQGFARILTAATVAAALWRWFFPQPYSLVVTVLAFLPWLAIFIAARSEGLFRIVGDKNDAHPNLAAPFIVPGFVLMLRSFDFHLLQLEPALMLAVGIGMALWIAAAAADPWLRQKRASLFIMLLFCAAYGYGASTEANALLDRSSATVYAVRILGKHTLSGRSTTYYLTLAAWGQQQVDSDVSVPRSFYQSVKTGERVCVAVRPGALRIPWYVVRECY